METIRTTRLWSARGPLGVAIGYYLLAALSLRFTQGAHGIATLWPASGFLLAALILAPRRRLACLAAAALASVAANIGAGTPLWLAAAFTVANVGEAWLAIAVLGSRRGRVLSFLHLSGLGLFCAVAFAAGLFSATLATLLSRSGWEFFVSWASTVVLGILIVTPVVVTLARLTLHRRASANDRSRLEVAALLSLVAVVAAGVFGQTHYPLLFLPMLAVLAVTYRLGVMGAAASVLLTAIIGSILTGRGSGPVQFVAGGPGTVVLFLQFYLLVLMASALPMAALLASRKALTEQLHQSNRLLRQAEAVAQVGHWSSDLVARTLFWSREVYRIHGLSPDVPPDIERALIVYHPDDRPRIKALLDDALTSGRPFDFDARVVRPDGAVRHVQSRGQVELDVDGRPVAMFGVLQDVTRHVEAAHELEQARRAAVEAAARERRLANTDQLTGLPNRRRTLDVLDRAIADAQASGEPLSVAILDIDHFKAVNDRCGHAAGDEVLRCVARTARIALRSGDFVGRYGGEEFVVVLPNAASGTAMRVAERVRSLIETESRRSAPARAVTVSLGVAAMRDGLSGEALLHLADQALYRAKASGRNSLFLAA